MKWLSLLFLVLLSCQNPYVAPPPNTGGVVIAVGANGSIARSLNNGQTWETSMANPNLPPSKVILGNKTFAGLVTFQQQPVMPSNQQGVNATAAAGQINSVNGASEFFSDLYVKGTLYQQLGQEWAQVTSPFGAVSILCIATDGLGNFMACTTGGSLSVSNNNGATWGAVITPAAFGGSNIWGVATNGTGTWVVSLVNGKIFYSTNLGATWTLATTFTIGGEATVTFANGIFMYGAWNNVNNNTFISTSPDGINWGAAVNTGGNVAVTEWIVYGAGTWMTNGSAGGGVYLSTNNGASWSSLISTGIAQLTCGAFGNGVFIVGGSDGGVSYSLNSGLTWTNAATNPFNPAVSIQSIAYLFGTFQIGTAGGATGRSYDNGKTWILSNNPFGALIIYAMAAGPSGAVAGSSVTLIATAGWNAVPLGTGAFYAPMPQSAAGVGQELFISTATTGVALALTTTGAVGGTVLPGTWEYKGFWSDAGAYMRTPTTPTTGVAAGGTTIVSAQAGFYAAAYIWRVS